MNFDLTEKEKVFLAEIEELFSHGDQKPSVEGLGEDRSALREYLISWAEKLAATGYLKAGVSGDATLLDTLAAQQSLAAFNPSLYFSLEFSARIFGRVVGFYGTPEMHRKILQPLFAGSSIGSVSLVNQLGGPDEEIGELQIIKKDREIFLMGTVDAVVNAGAADWMVVEGKIEDKYYFLLVKPTDKNCFVYENMNFLGGKNFMINKVEFNHYQVASEQVLGPYNDKSPLQNLNQWRDQVLALAAVGLMRRSFDEALKYSKLVKIDGNAPIKKQEIAFKLAEMWTLLDTAQLLYQRASWMLEQGEKEAATLISCAKAFCCESAEEVASKSLEILGVMGSYHSNPAEQSYRTAKIIQAAGTSTENSRLKIGSELLLQSQ